MNKFVVIYDVDLTEALFKVLEKFMKISKPTVFIALEKRYVHSFIN